RGVAVLLALSARVDDRRQAAAGVVLVAHAGAGAEIRGLDPPVEVVRAEDAPTRASDFRQLHVAIEHVELVERPVVEFGAPRIYLVGCRPLLVHDDLVPAPRRARPQRSRAAVL